MSRSKCLGWRYILNGIPNTSFGAKAVLQTNTVDGISFKGEAVLTANTQIIYLNGEGTPVNNRDKVMTITGNSQNSSVTCSATIQLVIPAQRLMTLANTDANFGYNLGLLTNRTTAYGYNSGNDMITSLDNFGYNKTSIVKFAGFTNKTGAGQPNMPEGAATAINAWVDDNRDIVCLVQDKWNAMTTATLESFLKGTNNKRKVDVFIIGYNVDYYRDANALDAAKCQVIVDYVKAGGILMICSEQHISN